MMLPALLVESAVLLWLLTVVSAAAPGTAKGTASNAVAAAESIKRCFVKIQFSSIVGRPGAG